MLLLLLLLLLLTIVNSSTTNDIVVTNKIINTIDETYASWNVDSSQNRGFFHIDFENQNLKAAATSLQPSILRFGGTGNDLLYYGTTSHPCNYTEYSHCTTTWSTGTGCCMNVSHWKSFSNFARVSNTPILFGVSFDMIAACRDGTSYVWNESNIREWIEEVYMKDDTIIYGFELGNELNNNRVVCNLSASQQSSAFKTFDDKIRNQLFNESKNKPVLVGPDTGYLDAKDWLEQFLQENTVDLHAVTHHVYPGITLENWNQSSVLNRPLSDMEWYLPIVKQSGFQVWAGEEGPHGGGEDGTCGTSFSACGTFASTFWYADDMALRASKGFTHFNRQDLVGARYGLVRIPHDDEYLAHDDEVGLSPDFWVNFFWKRTIGTNVLHVNNTGSTNNTLRAYAFRGTPVSPFSEYDNATLSLVVINQGSKAEILNLVLNEEDDEEDGDNTSFTEALSWSLQTGSTNYNNVNNSMTRVNGMMMPSSITDGKPIEKSPVSGKRTNNTNSFIIEPTSVTFLMVWF